jgi:autotransporter-associated beta strand protein
VSSPISFASGHLLTLEAARNVVLNNAFTLTGGSDLSIIAGGGLSGASGVSLASDSTLTVNQSGSSTYSGAISGAGSVTKSGAGTLTVSGTNTYTGETTVSAGTLSIGSGGITGSVTSASIVNSSLVEFNRSNDLTFSGVISGTGALTKLGGGTLTLTGNNTYSGVTTISNGTLAIGSGGSSGSITSASIVDNAALQFNRSDALTYSGTISGTGTVTTIGSGTLTLSGANTYSGATAINAGTLVIDNNTALGTNAGATTVSSGATLSLSGGITISEPITLNGTGASGVGALYNSSGTNTASGSITLASDSAIGANSSTSLSLSGAIGQTGGVRALTKLDGGRLVLTGTNSYSGFTTISAGVLSIGNGGTSGSIASTTMINNGSLEFNHGNDQTYSGMIGGTGTLTKLGTRTLILTGTNTYSGSTTITAGSLRLGIGSNSGSIASLSIINNSGLEFSRSDPVTYGGIISGTGAVTKNSGGTLTLTGENTYSGSTTVNSGTLVIGDGATNGSIASTTISNNGSLEFNRSNNLTYSGVISGTGSLSKLGAGALTLSGANTFSGATTISEGTLIAAHNTALGTAAGITTVQSGATLQISNGTAISTENLTVNGSGVSASSGALVLSATGNYSSGTITVASDSKLLINGLVTDPEVILGAMSGPANTLNINLASGRQVSQSAPANLNKLAFTGSAGIANFLNTGNTVNTIAAEIGSLSFVNSTDLTVGTVNPSGITATGIVSLSTVSGDLHVNAPITTSNLGSSNTPITLNAGTSSAAGTSTGGDIKIASGVTITSTGGGRTTLYTGGVTGSTGINNVVSYGSGNFRYNAIQASLPADVASSATGYYAIYREQPTIAVQADDKSKIFDNIPFSASLLTFTCTGCANGDSPLITYTGTAARGNALYIGAYPITATYDATYLTNVGYRVVGTDVTPGTLNIVLFPGYIPPARETVERASQIPIRYLIENMQPTKLKTVLADHPTLVSLFSTSLTKGEIKLAYQDGNTYRENVRLRERVVQDTIFFDAGKSNLTNEATRTLDSLLRTANRYSLNSVEVVGHTELPSNSEDALKLSEARASVVSDYLQNRLSRERRPEKIASLGRSYLQPISDNITYSGRARNRRTEVTITGISLE